MGRDDAEWIDYDVLTTEIAERIEKEESQNKGQFGKDDLWISIKELELEILFCHESDIHLYYNDQNLIVSDILGGWEAKKIRKTD